MSEDVPLYQADDIIRTIRGQRVIIDSNLARIYGVPVKRLNEQVKRNRDRFPTDFAFQLTRKEAADLRSQTAASSMQNAECETDEHSRSQFATLKQGQNLKYLPFAFTEHGVIMAGTVLNSLKAVEMSVFVVRAFVKMREQLLTTATLANRLAEVERTLLTHDSALRDLYQKIRPLLLPPPEPERKPIGFSVREKRAIYRIAAKAKRRVQ